ncbi:phage tail protein [Proteus genomosp. 6]|uniref:phage tail protein n=1 Tax=Proteus genomosp. 6 TaxID=1311820 RepID=UPI0032DA8B53
MKNPKLISKPFAQNGQKNVIPEKYETSMESNQATWDQGFGQITMLPVSAGGLPPKGQDFNGILNQMCETIVHISKGGVFKFSADYATAINGYPKGAILQSEDEKKYYQSLIDNNKVNFNTASQDQIKTSWKLVMTDDLLEQLSKKLESSAVVQSTGTSTTSVMSQKASTDAFQPKGTYPTTSEMNVELNKKIDKASISQQLANDINKVPSLDLVTKELGKKQQSGDYVTGSKLIYELGFKFDKSEVVQSTGISVTKIMSQNAVTEELNKKINETALVQSTGQNQYSIMSQRAVSDALDLKVNYTAIVQSTGQNNYSIMSQKASTDAFQAKGNYALKSDLIDIDNIPVGSPIPWSLSTAPSGYLICQGQTFNKTTYPKLATAYPSGKLPDLRGNAIRGLDAGRGIDVDRQILSEQSGNSLLSSPIMNNPEEKGFELKINNIGTTGGDNQGWNSLYQQIEGVNGNETRMRNIAFLYIVRAA